MQNLIQTVSQKDDSRIRLVVLDGLGGLFINGPQILEVAHIPNLVNPPVASACGMHILAMPVITLASGPGHHGLLGYNSVACPMGVAG